MGQGYSVTTPPVGVAGIDVPELSELSYEKSLGTARFMKSIRARHRDCLAVVKVVLKPSPGMKLEGYINNIREELDRERRDLADVPNALAYQYTIETSTTAFLIRQYLYSSLYDRLSTRPFLEEIEKKWLAFQLLCAVRDCHAREVFHGDIKTENILVTSWNWLYLTDFSSSFKPVYVPEDNPADYDYYFDTSRRRNCYLAPERFQPVDSDTTHEDVTAAMDIFSVGCVIAELFLEAPIFNLSQHLTFRNGDKTRVHSQLAKIENEDIRDLVGHMIQLQPESRYSAEEYLNLWRRKAFPEYFYSFLHQYMGLITDSSSGRAPVSSGTENLGEADERIDRLFYDFDKISYLLGYDEDDQSVNENQTSGDHLFPLYLDIPNNIHRAAAKPRTASHDGTVIFLNVIVASMRNTARATARIRGLDVITALSERLSDESILDRALPYVMTLLRDQSSSVKLAAIRTVTQLLALVRNITPINAFIFTEVVLPNLKDFAMHDDPLIRSTYASCLGSLAESASRFLVLAQSMRSGGSLLLANPSGDGGLDTEMSPEALYEDSRNEILEMFKDSTITLVNDPDFSVRRAFLDSVTRLCVFFGEANANDLILSYINTYLNEKDWMLKCGFFDIIVGVASFVGGPILEEYIVPVMIQGLTDPEEFVVERDIRALTNIAQLGLLRRSKAWEVVDIIGRFTMHPNIWIREAAAAFVAAVSTYLSPADLHCIITPILMPFLRTPISEYTMLNTLNALRKPLPRAVFDLASSWSVRADSGLFWKPLSQQATFGFPFSASHLNSQSLAKLPRTDEDDKWLVRLRTAGMSTEDEIKLIALREYIQWTAHDRQRQAEDTVEPPYQGIVYLSKQNIDAQNVFLYKNTDEMVKDEHNQEFERPLTIADALLDASMTIDSSLARRRRSGVSNGGLHIPRRDGPGPSPLASTPLSPSNDDDSDVQSAKDVNSTITLRPKAPASDSSSIPSSLNDVSGHLGIRHRPSAVSLLSRTDSTKALAETGMSTTSAFGKLQAPFPRPDSPSTGIPSPLTMRAKPLRRIKNAHSYEGNDPNILKVLENLYLENYSSTVKDFLPAVLPYDYRQAIHNSTGHPPEKGWKPEGVLVAIFGEHTAPINRVLVAPDHAFFITGSDDGTVKIWDSSRLERNVTHRAGQTHKHAPGSKVKALCFVENTHCFVSAASDGSLHVVKVHLHRDGKSTKYGKLSLLRNYQLPETEHAVWMDHFEAETHSLLLIATNNSRILALDLRNMDFLYSLDNPVHHGTISCFCIDRSKDRAWLLLGTSHGVLDLWDLRFKIRTKSWGIRGGTAIHRVSVHPTKGRGKWVCVAGGSSQGEITVWDIKDDKTPCREVYRVGGTSLDSLKNYEAWKVDDERPEGMLGRFASAIEPMANGVTGRGIRAFVLAEDNKDYNNIRYPFMISGGSDRKVRFWDMAKIEASVVVSGLDAEEETPAFTSTHPTTSLVVNSEKAPPQDTKQPSSRNAPNSSSKRAAAPAASRPSRVTVISLQQQQLLKTHLDAIMDVAFLAIPYGMTISVDRSGMIYVFQ